MQRREPIVNAPHSVVAVLALLGIIHAARGLLSAEQDFWFVTGMAFIPARYAGYAEQLPGGMLAGVTSFVTYMLVHANFMHLFVNCAWLLAFGSAVAQRIGAARFLVFGVVCGVASVALFLVLNPGLPTIVIGASGAVAGLMAGAFRFFFSALDLGGIRLFQERPQDAPRMTLVHALRDRRILLATGAFVAMNVLFAAGADLMLGLGRIAWEAHIGGYFAGLIFFGAFDHPSLPVR